MPCDGPRNAAHGPYVVVQGTCIAEFGGCTMSANGQFNAKTMSLVRSYSDILELYRFSKRLHKSGSIYAPLLAPCVSGRNTIFGDFRNHRRIGSVWSISKWKDTCYMNPP